MANQKLEKIEFEELDRSLVAEFSRLLVCHGAKERAVGMFCDLRGLNSGTTKSLGSVGGGLSAERVRQIIIELEAVDLPSFLDSRAANELRLKIVDAVTDIEKFTPGADDRLAIEMSKAGHNIRVPSTIVRLAGIFAVNHNLRITEWTSRSKYKAADSRELARPSDPVRSSKVTAIVQRDMPEVFDSFINFSRRHSRGAGVVGAGFLADKFSQERGVSVTQTEAGAFLSEFAVYLGRFNGDEWYSFFNSANDFIRKVSTRVSLFGKSSFDLLTEFHTRFNRSIYASAETAVPKDVLRATLELSGYQLDGDVVQLTPNSIESYRGATSTQTLMVEIFKKKLFEINGRKSVPRDLLLTAFISGGIKEATAHIYLGNQGLFICKMGLCRLANELPDQEMHAKKLEVAS